MSSIYAPERPTGKRFFDHSVLRKGSVKFELHPPKLKQSISSKTRQPKLIKKTDSRQNIFSKVLLFFALVIAIQGTSNFAGHIYIEKARRDYLKNQKKIKEMDLVVRQLRAEVDKLTDVEDLNTWALGHGFIPQELQRNVLATSSSDWVTRASSNLVASIIAE